MGLFLYKSNRMEKLAEALAALTAFPLDSPFAPEIVVVQSLGMRRWLSLQLAEKHGVCANYKFPFARDFVNEMFGRVLADPKPEESFERPVLLWRIVKLLPELGSLPAFSPVKNYISGHRANLKLFQLAGKIASLFDQYIVFRPQMIFDWEAGKGDDWQAILWRELIREGNKNHQATLGRHFAKELKRKDFNAEKLPTRVSLFGISSLPPFYIELLDVLSKHTEVHVFLLDPTEHLWSHIISDAEEDRIRRKLKKPRLTTKELHADEKNSLLASLGKTGRDFQDLILDLEPTEEKAFYVEPATSTMLSLLQADIFHLRDPEGKREASGNDGSIQFHSCHSPMREMEVLHDQMLALFETDPTLEPRDIVVMMPDVKTYSPFIEAVFGSAESDEKQIPFTIADRGVRHESSVADAFLRILEVSRSRFGAARVLEILESPAVQNRFSIAESDLETIRLWTAKAGVRWGIDARHRRNLELPALDENTWRAGLRRLLLGYALPGRGERTFADVLPFDDIEGGLAEVLGNFADFAEKLFRIAGEIEKPRTLLEWQKFFNSILNEFFSVDDEQNAELQLVRKIIGSLKIHATGFGDNVSSDVIFAHVRHLLDTEETLTGFLAGKVTFCALRPMRSVPFKVVCLVGMNDGSYPRPQRPLGFDKMAEWPKPGDRSPRHEDRYLFLEAILSARDVLYVSYVGRSLKDDSAIPPSVLVSELLDYLDRGFICGGKPIVERIVTQHRLQAFSHRYFEDGRFWSYSRENCAASQISIAQRSAPTVFLCKDLPEPEAEWRVIELDRLAKFFANPAEFLARQRLRIHLSKIEATLSERELFGFDGLNRYTAQQAIAEKKMIGADENTALTLLKAAGQLPLGRAGECQSRDLGRQLEDFIAAVTEKTQGATADLPLQLKIGGWELTGTVSGLTATHAVAHRCASLKAKDLLRAWLQHLAANVVSAGRTTYFIATDALVTFQPVADPKTIFAELLELYGQGLRSPLKFFPETSRAYAKRKFRPGAQATKPPLEVAWDTWADGKFPENADPYFDLCFRNMEDPLDAEFEAIAEKVFAPILNHSSEEKL